MTSDTKESWLMHYNKLNKDISSLQASLLLYSEFEYLYELCEIFDRDNLLKFLNIFSGQVIKVPLKKDIDDNLKYIDIWHRYRRDHTKKELDNIISDTGYTRKEVLAIYSDVDKKFDKLGIDFEKM